MSLSPGGTPKISHNDLIMERDELTPILTSALLKRFDAFNMSPEDDKENDTQYF